MKLTTIDDCSVDMRAARESLLTTAIPSPGRLPADGAGQFLRRTAGPGLSVALFVVVAVGLALAPPVALGDDITDSGGFEAPTFTTTFNSPADPGSLEGQGGFQRSSTGGFGAGAANVQSTIVESGTQAVEVNRLPNSDDRWSVVVGGLPTQPLVQIDWDMRVEDAGGATGEFGPFFGVEINDGSGIPVKLAGSFGVDATTGDILFQQETTGFLAETGMSVNFGEWNHFRLVANYAANTYSAFFNDMQLVVDEGFVDGPLSVFTDAPILAAAAAGDAGSQSLPGTAYFDNYVVTQIPEPGGLVLVVLGLVGALRVRWREA